jgi:hypothetical protein
MVYVAHPICVTPDPDTVIWRYLDLPKFISLLEKQALFFSTIGHLRQSDKHEGTYNQATIDAASQKQFSIHDIGSGLLRSFGKFVAVNCWHINPIESVAMWDVYLRSGEGIAIKSTFQRLVDSFAVSQKPEIMIGKVHYLSDTDLIPEPEAKGINVLNSYLWKRMSFQFEQELRAVVLGSPEDFHKHIGIYVPVNLNLLVEEIVISPKTARWIGELIRDVASKYGIQEKVTTSILSRSPGILDENSKFSVELTCPVCNFAQEIAIEPFQIQDYPDNSTIVFSADRVSFQCQNCSSRLHIPVRPQMEYKD